MRFALTAGILTAAALAAVPAAAEDGDGFGRIRDGVATAAPAAPGAIEPTVVAPGFVLGEVARGTDPLENPSGIITRFGLLSTGTPTEPDQNAYLVFKKNPGGPQAGFDYGRHFLIQGHENGGGQAYVTRINLDVPRADPHRITLVTPPTDAAGTSTGLSAIDGSAFNPFTGKLMFTQENGAAGGAFEISATWPPGPVVKLDGILGRAGYEGIHLDEQGRIYLAEDVGGASTNVIQGNPASPRTARQPNSFIYRFVPNDPTNLQLGGKLQAVRVTVDGQPLVFGGTTAAAVAADVFSPLQAQLRDGTAWPFTWVDVHDTRTQGTAPFDANALAKAAGATPFKRPENLAFLPDHFRALFFTETGDTDATSGNVPALAARGAWGSIFRLDLDQAGNGGTIKIFAAGDADHASFDNIYFASQDIFLTTEDRGDTLHDQLNRLDSIWAYDVKTGRSVRFLALGRDALSSPVGAEDNEPTGMMVSNGATSLDDMVGTKDAVDDDARAFFTMQHGNNVVFEVLTRNDERQQANRR